jgi:UTP:GlnB (protein PII) uridylyltransferase
MQKKSSSTVKVYYPRYRRDELIQYLKQKVGLLAQRIPLKLVMLFGSYAEGRYTAASDIDLLVVYEGRKRDDIYKIVWDTIALPNLQPHIYTADEWNMSRPRAWKGVVIYQLGAP